MVLNVIHQFQKAAHHRGGWKKLIQHMYSNGDYPFKFGTHIGTDQKGNKYYENVKDYPFGQHRWVEFADSTDYDASHIAPEWHGWMVSMYDTPGDKLDEAILASQNDQIQAVRASKELKEAVPIALGHQEPVSHFENKHNQSQVRERGYMVGNPVEHFPPGATEQFYKLPGSLMNANCDKGGRFVEARGSIKQHEKEVEEPESATGKVRTLSATDNSWPASKGEVRSVPTP